jgi:hypothetical protein
METSQASHQWGCWLLIVGCRGYTARLHFVGCCPEPRATSALLQVPWENSEILFNSTRSVNVHLPYPILSSSAFVHFVPSKPSLDPDPFFGFNKISNYRIQQQPHSVSSHGHPYPPNYPSDLIPEPLCLPQVA